MSEWRLLRIAEYCAKQTAQRQLLPAQLAEIADSFKKEISAARWPCAAVRIEFRGHEGYDVVVELTPLPTYSSQRASVKFIASSWGCSKECPMTCLSRLFRARNDCPNMRLMLQTANGGALNITNYTTDVPLRSIWEPTLLWTTTLADVCAVNKHVRVILQGLMLLLPDADQATFDTLLKAVRENWCALKDKTRIRSPELTLEVILDSEAVKKLCMNGIVEDSFFADLAAKCQVVA